MKILQKITLITAFAGLFASCQSGTDVNMMLSKPETRKVAMDTIANDSSMSAEMMTALMNSKNGKMTMMGNHKAMMEMMKGDPEMMKSMMSNMMKTVEGDTTMMNAMSKAMMENKSMMDRMGKMKAGNKDMGTMKGMDHSNMK